MSRPNKLPEDYYEIHPDPSNHTATNATNATQVDEDPGGVEEEGGDDDSDA